MRARGSILTGAEEARFAALGVISGFLAAQACWATWAAAASKSPRRSTITSAIAGSACRSALCRSKRCLPTGLPEAKRRIDAMLQATSSAGARQAGVLSGRRRLARVGQGAHGSGQRAGQGCSRLHAGDRGSARLRKIAVAADARQTGGDARRARTARPHIAGGGARARSRAEAARPRARRVFRARACARAFSIRS